MKFNPAEFEDVPVRYFVRLLRELIADGQLKSAKLLLEDAYAEDERVFWRRDWL